ncbi:hypothetical protein D9619_005027 [Psilocybe cf. subviscida]|uniref:non-specific serine/threonine protein kinase n=1 Tax=Psilocybe cf. subviscida TaxID=2480587 RepID=A0A8H5BPT9_9AGAR|nr:hypothetical protein D9619_005027 [Psilocybe cf. subviscida]
MEEFRKLMSFLLLMLTTLALKKKATSDLSSFIPTLSVRHAPQSFYELWDIPLTSVKSSPIIKLSFRTKSPVVVVPPVVDKRCVLADRNYTLLTTQSYNEWFAEDTGTSPLRLDPPVKQQHQGPIVIFHRHYRITALILSDLVADAFKTAWDSASCRRLIDLIILWGATVAFWVTSVAGPENMFAFEQLRAALFPRHDKRRRYTSGTPAPGALLQTPSPDRAVASMLMRPTHGPLSKPPPYQALPQPAVVKTTDHKSNLALDLERQLDRALRLEYAPPSLVNIVQPEAEESLVALEYISLPEDVDPEKVPERDAAAEMRERMRDYLPPESDEGLEAAVVATQGKPSLPTTRVTKRPRRSVEELVGQVTEAPRELTEEEKEARTEERRRKSILVRTYLHMSVPRMAPRFPPVPLNTPYMFSAKTALDEGEISACVLTPRSVDVAPPILLKRDRKPLFILRMANVSEPEHFKGVKQEMKALRLLVDCEWAARLVCYCSERTYVEVQLRYYPPKRSFRSLMSKNGGFLSSRAAVFYLAELIVAIQAFHSYGLIHTDIRIDDLTISPRGDIVIQNFDQSEIFYGGRLPHWIPRHENFFEPKPVGYDDYVRAAYLYHEMLTGVTLEGGAGPLSRNRKQQSSRKQEPRTIDFDFIHFVIGTYPILPRSANSIFEHALFKDINWRAIKDQAAAVPICHKTLRELEGD